MKIATGSEKCTLPLCYGAIHPIGQHSSFSDTAFEENPEPWTCRYCQEVNHDNGDCDGCGYNRQSDSW